MHHVGAVAPVALAEAIRKAPLSPEKVTFAWRVVVGPAIDKVTAVHLSADGVLHVRAETPAWTVAVGKSSTMICARLEAWLGADIVRRVQCD